ncbi:MAG: D-alanine--D-alanine ligase family protein [Lachnospiraceae bacterium]|nr:D-alanine--D-alanine ligase family protein [Lachnospiraceae bacterium]
MDKKCVAVIFGGCSSEHEVSCVSVQTIIRSMDKDKYDILMIGITKDGSWLKTESVEDIASGAWRESKVKASVLPDRSIHGVMLYEEGKVPSFVRVDVAFPVLHGLNGEDGTIQGLFELAGIPYVGCGILASAASMDKFYTKIIADRTGVRQAAYTPVLGEELEADVEAVLDRVEAERTYPVFVKPSRAGSSCGVSKAEDRAGLKEALLLAAKHDRKILVEETIIGREVECAVLGAYDPKASGIGEVLAGEAFYTYEAKYSNPESQTVIDPEMPEETVETIRRYAVEIFKALDCFGLSRVDFFVCEDQTVVFNEINTLPGFTSISMYPMLWEARGIEKTKLVDTLIAMAFDR